MKRTSRQWEEKLSIVKRENEEISKKHIKDIEKEKKQIQAEVIENLNKLGDSLRTQYERKEDVAGLYAKLVLSCLTLPMDFPHEYKIIYVPETKILAIDYWLPRQENVSKLKEERKLKTRNEIKQIEISKKAHDLLYDSVVYQLVFVIFSILYTSDKKSYYSAINFNGWVNNIDMATGHEKNTCILSINVSRERFNELDLHRIDPKETFRYLKGIGSPKLHSMVAVKPIMMLNKEDSRFVNPYNVAYKLNEEVNLAAMDWEDFEHLVREVFAKKLGESDIEVKITQSSRDKGVDAIAFNPDPITGGKIVIQAKRYTNVVGVSAVRDLYGTIVNEGANKGILVTTSNYGKDAYEFAKDKPITLIRGAELLSLLEECGYQAKIDLRAAKKVLKDKGH